MSDELKAAILAVTSDPIVALGTVGLLCLVMAMRERHAVLRFLKKRQRRS